MLCKTRLKSWTLRHLDNVDRWAKKHVRRLCVLAAHIERSVRSLLPGEVSMENFEYKCPLSTLTCTDPVDALDSINNQIHRLYVNMRELKTSTRTTTYRCYMREMARIMFDTEMIWDAISREKNGEKHVPHSDTMFQKPMPHDIKKMYDLL